MRRIPRQIAILTDFGAGDNYNGVMEAVIKRINPQVEITYITGDSKKFNITAGAYLLYTSYKYFTRNTIFLVVIDPGVGTRRRPLIIKTTNYMFVGPDNGVLFPAAKNDGIQKIIEISNNKLYLSKMISNTFHGRDIFSVAAAFLSAGIDLNVFGNEVKLEDITKLDFDYRITKNEICGKVVYIDHFGNVATSIPRDVISNAFNYDQEIVVKVNDMKHNCKFVKTFGYGNENELLIYSNGYFMLEIGINKGSAQDKLNVKEGDEICIEGYTQEDFSHFI
ncbi:S-adenosyl-l-methionine hydroxide adenosyltransferase family protein [Sulfolobus tengchongensis]|uniref:S-adenosyl-l-methionine hydroxide adenosyltransferase family protein n=1 Tax=Sulfolobus tengchongensis TaxID=207809 RepID=A0AAX4L082_9CREN